MNFTVYSKQGCPFCTKVVQVLQLSKLNHVVYELDHDFDKQSFYGQFGQGSTFPSSGSRCYKSWWMYRNIQYLKEKQISLMKDDFENVYDMLEHAIEYAFDG